MKYKYYYIDLYGAQGGEGGSNFISSVKGFIVVNRSGNPICTSGNSVACVTHYSEKVFVKPTNQRGVKTGDGQAYIKYYGPSAL